MHCGTGATDHVQLRRLVDVTERRAKRGARPLWRRLATGAAAAFGAVALLGACAKTQPLVTQKPLAGNVASAGAIERKPTAVEAIIAGNIQVPPRSPIVPAHRDAVIPESNPDGPPQDAALIALGKSIFSDAALSEPAGTSCASCHDPRRAFSGNHGSALGVALGSRPGHFARRATPSVLYLRFVPKFHYFDDDEAAEPAPVGGFFWDGRADTIAELVRQPLFNPDEMNAGNASHLAAKLTRASYAGDLLARAGKGGAPEKLLRAAGEALEAYLTSDEMTPATSKYDAYVRGEATLTPQEKRGLEAFKDPARGSCAGCHRMNETSPNPRWSTFTDYGFDAVGVPRNGELPASRDPARFDLGLCERKDTQTPSHDGKWCGSFRTPSLRNVAVREAFMHNGRFKKLRDVVVFYATRATAPEHFYPPGQKFDDLPVAYRENVNVSSRPYNHPAGGTPPINDEDIDAIVAFLKTLTDAAYVGVADGPS
jgi:cytochrome c peroxidase